MTVPFEVVHFSEVQQKTSCHFNGESEVNFFLLFDLTLSSYLLYSPFNLFISEKNF